MNTIKCGECVNFKRETKGTTKGPVPSTFGWCKELSVFPAKGMDVPEGAKTTTADRSKPEIVLPDAVKAHCPFARRA